MWLINGTVCFRGPNAYQLRNSHSLLSDFEQEQQMYLKTEKLISFLYKWKCLELEFFDCVLDLSIQMSENNFWDIHEVESIKNWLADLKRIGYAEPKIINTNYNACSNNLDLNSQFKIRYSPIFQKNVDFENYCCEGQTVELYKNFESLKYIENYCSAAKVNLNLTWNQLEPKSKSKFNDIILLITFNHAPIEENIVMIRNLYGQFFKNIVFCGKNITKLLDKLRAKTKKFDSFTFIDLDTVYGYLHYYCMNKLIEMSYNIETGILLMSDDVLLKYWSLEKRGLNLNKIWIEKKLSCKIELNPVSMKSWNVWTSSNGYSALIKLKKELSSILSGEVWVEPHVLEVVKSFVFNLNSNQDLEGRGSNFTEINRVCLMNSDIFYLPKDKFNSFRIIAEYFRKYTVFLEIAVPTILSGLDAAASSQELVGKYFWYSQYDFKTYEANDLYYHPVKLTIFRGNLSMREKFCKYFIKELLMNV